MLASAFLLWMRPTACQSGDITSGRSSCGWVSCERACLVCHTWASRQRPRPRCRCVIACTSCVSWCVRGPARFLCVVVCESLPSMPLTCLEGMRPLQWLGCPVCPGWAFPRVACLHLVYTLGLNSIVHLVYTHGINSIVHTQEEIKRQLRLGNAPGCGRSHTWVSSVEWRNLRLSVIKHEGEMSALFKV